MSSYIVNREPGKYGGKQEDYLRQVNAIVENASSEFHIAVESGKSLTALFHETIGKFGELRQDIAVKNGTSSAIRFGIRRDDQDSFSTPAGTILGYPYEEYGQRLMTLFQEKLGTMKPSDTGFLKVEKRVKAQDCMGRSSYTHFSVFTQKFLKEDWPDFSFEEYQRLCELSSIPCSKEAYDTRNFEGLVKNKAAMQRLREESVGDQEFLRIAILFRTLRKMLNIEPKSELVLMTQMFEIDGKKLPLSQYITWVCFDNQENPIEYMSEHSVITIIHQDALFIEPMLEDIAKIFKQAIEWDKKDIKVLKNLVALLEYEFAHAMPFIRGSAAVSEWLEMAIYRYHDLKIIYDQTKMVNLEALTLPLPEFVEAYDSLVQVV